MGKPQEQQNTVLAAALDYFCRGLSIIPIKEGTKKPAIRSWKPYQAKMADEKQLCKWFGKDKYTSLAVVCGAVSGGLAVLDLDSEQRCQWWRDTQPELADTLSTVKTIKGLHIYFRSEVFPKRNGDEVDLLCEGAYVVLPPSPGKKWLMPLNGELPLLNPFEWGLEQFDITTPQKEKPFTEEGEDIEATSKFIASISSVSSNSSISSVNLKEKVDNAIKKTLPKKEGYRNFLIFQFCRWLKGMEEFEQLPARALKDTIREWHRQALPYIGTKPFDETWANFTYGWPRVKYPKKGDGMLKLATQRAMNPKNKLAVESQYDAPETQLLIRVCYELQLIQKDEPFWISCYDAGGIIGLSHTEANKRLQMLVADEVLRLIVKNTTNKATRFRYIA